MPKEPKYVPDETGLPVENVGPWVRKKHKILTDYVGATGAARRKYLGTGAAYIDVFCGPGRSRIRTTGDFVDGSAVAAFKSGARSYAGFSSIEISDADNELQLACQSRLRTESAPVCTAKGPAVEALKEIVGRIDQRGLHFAFLDPHNLGTLSFSLFRELAKLQRVDIIAHVSVADLQRNTDLYTSADQSEFDEFAPGWRMAIGADMHHKALRRELIRYWTDQVEALGLPRAEHCELVTGEQSQRLYWLIFLSRHELAHKIWKTISSEAKSPTFDF